MRFGAMLLAAGLALLSGWAMLASGSTGAASTGSTLYMPLLMRDGWLEKVSIVQHDGHQAVYWPSPMATTPPYFYYPTPTATAVAGIPVYLEVANHTDRSITGVNVEFRALNSSGSPITDAITQTGTLVDVLAPGQTSPVVFNIPFPGGFSAFQAATKEFTVQPDWTYTDWETAGGLEVGWGYSYYPPGYPTLTPVPPAPPSISGWVRNKGSTAVTGATVVLVIRGNDQASGLILEATKVPVNSPIYPGSYGNFNAYFGRDYGNLFGSVEVTVQRRMDIPGILEATSW